MSWRTDVIADNSGQWVGNGLRFATKPEAENYVSDLAYRWTLVRETRVVEVDEPVNYAWTNGGAMRLEDNDAPAPSTA